METKLVRIAEISVKSKHPIFTSVYHLINEDMLKQCHKELDGNKAVGIDKVTKDEYGKNLEWNIQDKNLLWLIRKYLKAGIMEQGKFEPTEEGSAQGSVMSPMLANIYMHHVLTLWFKLVVQREMLKYYPLAKPKTYYCLY